MFVLVSVFVHVCMTVYVFTFLVTCPRLVLAGGKAIPPSFRGFDALCGLWEEATGSGPPLPGPKEGAVGPVHVGRTWSCLPQGPALGCGGAEEGYSSGKPLNREGIKIWDTLVL